MQNAYLHIAGDKVTAPKKQKNSMFNSNLKRDRKMEN